MRLESVPLVTAPDGEPRREETGERRGLLPEFCGLLVPSDSVTGVQSFLLGGPRSSSLLPGSPVETWEKPLQPVRSTVVLSLYLAKHLGVSAFPEPVVARDGSVVA